MSLDAPSRPDSRRGNLNTSHGDSKAVEDVQEALETETSTFMGGGWHFQVLAQKPSSSRLKLSGSIFFLILKHFL